MRKRWHLLLGIGLPLCGLIVAPLQADEPPRTTKRKVQTLTVREAALPQAGKYWIGVQVAPIGDALKSQLGLEDRLIVQDVLDDSPAAQAGIREHDVLLKVGDREIAQLENLVEAIDAVGAAEISLTVLRGGASQEVKVTPAERPEHQRVLGIHFTEEGKPQVIESPLSLRYHVVGPGVVVQADELKARAEAMPPNLSISVSKSGDEPTRIKVERGEQKWELTEDQLDDLPEDIRPFVQRMVAPDGRKTRLEYQVVPRQGPLPRLRVYSHAQVQSFGSASDADSSTTTDAAADSATDSSADSAGGGIEQLRKEIEQLRREIQKLVPKR